MIDLEGAENNNKKTPRGIAIIAVWMMLLIVPGIFRTANAGLDAVVSPAATIEWAYYGCAFGCAIGLLRLRELARRWTIGLFVIHFLGVLTAVYYLSGPSWDMIIELQSSNLNIAAEMVKRILVFLIAMYILWQFIVILYLTHPRVKAQFIPKD